MGILFGSVLIDIAQKIGAEITILISLIFVSIWFFVYKNLKE